MSYLILNEKRRRRLCANKKRRVTDKATICAMLDEMDTINLGMYDEPFPYVVPLNFGYEWNDELIFLFPLRP